MSTDTGMKRRGARTAPTVVVIEHHTLARTAIVRFLENELTGWNIVDMACTESLEGAQLQDVRLIALDLACKSVGCPSVHEDLTRIAQLFPNAPIALLSNTDDIPMASQALRMGVKGFFTTTLPIEIAIAGLRLVLAGGVFCPHPFGELIEVSREPPKPADEERPITSARMQYLSIADFTPREADVLAQLQSGCSNKVIAGKLNLSGHTVKMHLQHIMRKLQVQNRTEVVARLGHQLSNGHDIAAE